MISDEASRVIAGLGLFILGVLCGFFIGNAIAHTPCDYVENEPYCHYVQVVNPVTGILEQHYVCE